MHWMHIHPCLSFVGWHRSCVPSWRMYAGYRRWPLSSAVCWQSNVLGQEIAQPVQWPLFCHRRANAVEQSAWTPSATGHHLRTIQTIVENFYVWLAVPWPLVFERQGCWLEIFLLTVWGHLYLVRLSGFRTATENLSFDVCLLWHFFSFVSVSLWKAPMFIIYLSYYRHLPCDDDDWCVWACGHSCYHLLYYHSSIVSMHKCTFTYRKTFNKCRVSNGRRRLINARGSAVRILINGGSRINAGQGFQSPCSNKCL